MLLTAYVFSKIQTAKDLVRPMSQKCRLEHVEGFQKLVISDDSSFIKFFHHPEGNCLEICLS